LKFFRVRNFEKFQHYKDRNPPWIKLYRSILDDPRFFQLAEADRFLLLGIFILASQTDNRLPANQAWLKTKLLTKKPVPIELLVEAEWLEWLEDSASAGASKKASKSAISGASTFASPRALARDREETESEKREIQSPFPQVSQTQTVIRSNEDASERLSMKPETLENVWFAIKKELQGAVTPGGLLQFWAGLKLLGFDVKHIHVSCPYDPGEDKAWMEEMLTKAAQDANHDRGRTVRLAVLLNEPVEVSR